MPNQWRTNAESIEGKCRINGGKMPNQWRANAEPMEGKCRNNDASTDDALLPSVPCQTVNTNLFTVARRQACGGA
eukprot:33305-Chlamydomonas_euryale.AAC.1